MKSSDRPLHLGYVLRSFPRLSQSFVLNEIRALERIGHRVTIFSIRVPDAEGNQLAPTVSGRTVQYLESANFWRVALAGLWTLCVHPLRLIRTLIRVARTRDIEFARTVTPALLIARRTRGIEHFHAHLRRGTDVAWIVHQLTGRRYSFTVHARDLFVSKLSRHLSEKLATADFAVTVCESNKTLLAQKLPESTPRIHVIHPFLDRALFLTAEPHRTREAADGVFNLVSVSRLVPKKGVAILLEALSLLKQRGIQVQTSIIGEGPERARLESLVYRLGLAEQVSLPGSRNAAGVRALLEAADCFALASVRAPDGDADATPTVIGEAMILGLPVISTHISGIPEIVPDGSGLLVEPGDARSLADAIAHIANLAPENCREMGAIGRTFALTHWNCDHDAQRLATLFKRSVEPKAE